MELQPALGVSLLLKHATRPRARGGTCVLALPKPNKLFSCVTEAGWGLESRGVRGDPFKCLLSYKSQVPLLIPRAFRPHLLFQRASRTQILQHIIPVANWGCTREHGEMVGVTVSLVLAWDGCGDVSGHSDSAIGNVPRMLQATFPLCHDVPGWPEPRLPAWDSGDLQHTAAHQVTPWGAPQPPHSPLIPDIAHPSNHSAVPDGNASPLQACP